MANLSITNACNKKCAYCFANDTVAELGQSFIDEGTYDKALEYLQRSGLKQVRLLGGEPTLHPGFSSMVKKALDREFSIMLFTNGLMNQETLEYLASLPASRLSILLNTIHPTENNESGAKRQEEVMKRLGKTIIAGVNIYSPEQDLDYLLDHVDKYNLKREIRLGISHPVLSRNNLFLHPKDYVRAGSRIVSLKKKALKKDITLGFDCGFVPCMFPAEETGILASELKKAGNCCHPVIDMLSDGSFIACYPLNNIRKIPINDQLAANTLITKFEETLSRYRGIGIFPYCTSCNLFNTRCNGGCLSYRIRRYSYFHRENLLIADG
jgi:MoaA/NifB/PqqE/SkfB family radical SAM enzyme